MKKAKEALSKANQIAVISCQEIIPAPFKMASFEAIRRGKFIYTPRSSQPIGNGRITLISETAITKVSARNTNSAEIILKENGEIFSEICIFLISEKICLKPKKLQIVKIPKVAIRKFFVKTPKNAHKKRIKVTIASHKAVSVGALNLSGRFFQNVFFKKMLAPIARNKNAKKTGIMRSEKI